MRHLTPALWPLFAATLLLNSCSQPSAAPSVSAPAHDLTAAKASSPRTTGMRTLATVDCPEGGTVTPLPAAPTAPLESVAKLPQGTALHLDFKAAQTENGQANASQIRFADGKAFEVRFSEGETFEVLDADATDGKAHVQLPRATYDTYLKTQGKPGGSLTVTDPIYFLSDTLSAQGAKPDWNQLGLRALPFPADYGLGDYRLMFDPRGLTSFSSRWFTVTDPAVVAPLPPLPPSITRLSGPDAVAPGATGTVSATVSDPNGDPLTYRWTTTLPNGESISSTPTGGASATWTAPLPAGTYRVSLTVEDGTFTTTICESLPIQVPNLCPVPSLSAGGNALPATLKTGESVDLTASGTDPNGDALTWSWTATGGTLNQAAGTSTRWTAPTVAGTYTVTAKVNDGQGCEVPLSHTIEVLAPAPTPTPTPAPTPTPGNYGAGTKLKFGLYATTNQTVISQEVDLSGLPRLHGIQSLRIGYFTPMITNDYVYEKDNNGNTVQFSWNYQTWGSYPSSPTAQSRLYMGSLTDGAVNQGTIFTRVGFIGNTAVILDAAGKPLPKSRSVISSVPYPANTTISQLVMRKAVLKQLTPVRKYKLYFLDGSIGESDTYSLGQVTGRVVATSSRGSVVMPIGTRFKCGVSDNSNVTALEAFTPVLPPAIERYF